MNKAEILAAGRCSPADETSCWPGLLLKDRSQTRFKFMRLIKALLLIICPLIAAALLPAPASAVDISTHSFAGCGFPDTGQTLCYSTTPASLTIPVAVPCPVYPDFLAGQDGYYSMSPSSPSFTLYTGLVTVDNRTGLMWESTGSYNGALTTWANALAVCEASTFAGYSDWRLPNVRELMSIADYDKLSPSIQAAFFPNTITSAAYWTSTTHVSASANAFDVEFAHGAVDYDSKSTYSGAVRCVRGGPSSSTAPAGAVSAHAFNSGMNCNGVWELPDSSTGTISYGAGDDTAYQPAASSPTYTVSNPVNSSSVTVDNVTGLMWVTNPATDAGFNNPGRSTWAVALSSCEALDYANYTDWRLPNVRELQSIVDYGMKTVLINSTAFPDTQKDYYWASTTYIGTPTNQAWTVRFDTGGVSYSYKTEANSHYVRCVRGGRRY